jgi:hypothetical protein
MWLLAVGLRGSRRREQRRIGRRVVERRFGWKLRRRLRQQLGRIQRRLRQQQLRRSIRKQLGERRQQLRKQLGDQLRHRLGGQLVGGRLQLHA